MDQLVSMRTVALNTKVVFMQAGFSLKTQIVDLALGTILLFGESNFVNGRKYYYCVRCFRLCRTLSLTTQLPGEHSVLSGRYYCSLS